MRFSWSFALALVACAPAPRRQPAAVPPPAPMPQPVPEAPAPSPQPEPSLENQPKGHLASSTIQRVVRANFSKMSACYEAGLARNPQLAGKVRVRMVIAQDGRVHDAAHEPAKSGSRTTLGASLEGNEPPITDPQVIACVVAEFRKLVFPAPSGGIVVATYPLIFSSE